MRYGPPPARLAFLSLGYFSAALVVDLVAFWPSFFGQLSRSDFAHLFHGVTATVWLVVPILQAWLILRRRPGRHRLVGWIALAVLVPVLLVSGVYMVQLMVISYQTNHAVRLMKFAFIDLSALLLFICFLVMSIRAVRRGDVDGHVRYMAATVVIVLEPILERVFVFFVPGVPGFAEAAVYSLITLEVMTSGLVILEWRGGRVRPPFAITLGFFCTMHALMTPIGTSSTFTGFANWLATV
jgi:hypothetical protein